VYRTLRRIIAAYIDEEAAACRAIGAVEGQMERMPRVRFTRLRERPLIGVPSSRLLQATNQPTEHPRGRSSSDGKTSFNATVVGIGPAGSPGVRNALSVLSGQRSAKPEEPLRAFRGAPREFSQLQKAASITYSSFSSCS
jgi:hypothetical protein